MIGARRALAFALVAGCVMAAARPCMAAVLDPDTADEQVREALASSSYSFCSTPGKPLSPRAKKLCPLAADIPDCAALVAVCAGDAAKKDELPEFPGGTLGAILAFLAQGGVWVLVLAVLAAIAFPLVQAVLRARKDRTLSDPLAEPLAVQPPTAAADEEPTVTDAERLLTLAEDHARRGELDRALFAYLQASLRALDERGAIRIERHRTHGEYVRSCKEAGARATLREIVREVDRVRFGGDRPTAETVAKAASRAAALVRVATLVVLGVLALTGCGHAKTFAEGTDPAEDGLLLDVLRRQGMNVGRLGGSLATLPMAKPGDAPPIVLVDAERTPLEDDTRAHLLQWIEAGGTLILAGQPETWPKTLSASEVSVSSLDVRIVTEPPEDEEDLEPRIDHAKIARSNALSWGSSDATIVATLESGQTYAGLRRWGKGQLLGVANGDLFTNAGLARPGNAGALMALLGQVNGGMEWRVARAEDGISPPTNPVTSLVRAGLGKGLFHAMVAAGLLFLAAGVRQARPRRTAAPTRRAFAEHVEANGALYAATKLGAHALTAYAKYADDRLRAKMPRGMTDPAAFLAARSGADPATCARLWARATEPNPFGGAAQGDELLVLKHLSSLVTAATRTE